MNNIENMSIEDFNSYISQLINKYVDNNKEDYKSGKLNKLLNSKIKTISNIKPNYEKIISEDINISNQKIEKRPGVYKIINLVNNKIYVGSSIDLYKRKSSHFSALRNNFHCNKYLQSSYNKYGENNFIFDVIEYIDDKDKLLDREQYWLDTLNPCDNNIGYNMLPTAGNSLGFKFPKEYKEKMGVSCRGEKIIVQH